MTDDAMNTINSTTPPLSAWQARQAAMLYHFASTGFLQSLHRLTTDLIEGSIDPLLALAQAEGRERAPDLSGWSAHGWPFLTALRTRLADDIAKRRIGVFRPTDVSNSLRRTDDWLVPYISPADEARYEALEQLLGMYASPIDDMFSTTRSRWDDFHFALYARFFDSLAPRIATCRIRTDLTAETEQLAPRTGVYVSADDQHASLQFAVAGAKGAPLRPASTFSKVGLDALHAVGRESLWCDQQAMLRFALHSRHAYLFRQVVDDGTPDATLAPSSVACHAFTERACGWHFVEIVDQ